ncbi:hypothetical protein KI387_042474, partial [Taxus chinensis]
VLPESQPVNKYLRHRMCNTNARSDISGQNRCGLKQSCRPLRLNRARRKRMTGEAEPHRR